MKFTTPSLILAAGLAFAAAGSAAAAPTNLISNGSFETNTLGAGNQFNTEIGYGTYGQFVTGWTSAAGAYNAYVIGGRQFQDDLRMTTTSNRSPYSESGQYLAAFNTDPDGGNFVFLDGDTRVNGTLSQVVTGLTAGNKYTLTFDYGATTLANRSSAITETLTATLGGESHSVSTTAAANAFSGWFTASIDFTATAATETLSFLSVGSPLGLPPVATLDGVSLTAAVPEPVSLALLGAGLFGVGLVRRRRRA